MGRFLRLGMGGEDDHGGKKRGQSAGKPEHGSLLS